MSDEISVTITRQDKYRFLVDFGPDIAKSVADEPAPLGTVPVRRHRSCWRPPLRIAFPPAFSSLMASSRRIQGV